MAYLFLDTDSEQIDVNQVPSALQLYTLNTRSLSDLRASGRSVS